MGILREKLKEYCLQDICNVDKTALFFQLLPRRIYVLEGEEVKNLRGTKSMKAKDRVTAILCSNANGTKKLTVSILGVPETREPSTNNNHLVTRCIEGKHG